MLETTHTRKVREFMYQANQATPNFPRELDPATRILRAKLILEEALETVRALGVICDVDIGCLDNHVTLDEDTALSFNAFGEYDLVEIIDGCCDIKVVTTGTLLACGVSSPDTWQDVIDDSNLDKFKNYCRDCGGVNIEDTEADHVVQCKDCKTTFKVGHHRDDGKWMKPSNWKAPAIKERLENG